MNNNNSSEKAETKTETQENAVENKPDEKPEKSTEEIRQEKWDKTKDEIEYITDGIGHTIDEKIKKAVASLNVFDINTSGSCEGHHDDYGAGAPWVQIEAPNQPTEIYNDQKNILERVARENNISVDDLRKDEKFGKLYLKAMTESEEKGTTKEMLAWEEENKKLRMVIKDIVSDFYAGKAVAEDAKLMFEDIGGWGGFRIICGTEEDYDKDFDSMSEKDKEELGRRLETYRKELNTFSDFLKDKFFSEGEKYIHIKRKGAQEKIDQEKLEALRNKQ